MALVDSEECRANLARINAVPWPQPGVKYSTIRAHFDAMPTADLEALWMALARQAYDAGVTLRSLGSLRCREIEARRLNLETRARHVRSLIRARAEEKAAPHA